MNAILELGDGFQVLLRVQVVLVADELDRLELIGERLLVELCVEGAALMVQQRLLELLESDTSVIGEPVVVLFEQGVQFLGNLVLLLVYFMLE